MQSGPGHDHALGITTAPLKTLMSTWDVGSAKMASCTGCDTSAVANPCVCKEYSRSSTDPETSNPMINPCRQGVACAALAAIISAGKIYLYLNKTLFYQCPVLGIDIHGSAAGNASPFCSSSIDTLSGDRTKAMRPSRGGRLIVTPASINFWQRA